MGKKGLYITIFCSVAVIFVLGIFNIVNLVKKSHKPIDNGTNVSDTINKGSNKGSAEDPYYIYDTDTFNDLLTKYGSDTKPVREKVKTPVMVPVMIESTDENGDIVLVEKKDENGNIIYEEKKDENGNIVYQVDENGNFVYKKDFDGNFIYEEVEGKYEPYHFELYRDIDFAGKEYKILFNNGKAFKGVFDGKGYSVKNISINITTENLKDNVYVISQSENEKKAGAYAHIAVFGDFNGASLTNIVFDSIEIKIADDVFSYIENKEFYEDVNASLKELTVGGIVACAGNSTIEANVTAKIDADSYSNYANNENTGRNYVGGVVGYAYHTSISNLENGKSAITIIADSGKKNYYMGGVVGGLVVGSEIRNIDVSVDITASAAVKADQEKGQKSPLYIGGVAGYVLSSNIKNGIVALNVKQVADESRYSESYASSELTSYVNKVGGIVSIIRANDDTQISVINNVNVTSNVDMDCFFGGALYQVKNKELDDNNEIVDKDAIYVTLEDLTLNSTVKTLQAYGIASALAYTEIKYSNEYQYSIAEVGSGTQRNYNILLNGVTTLKSSSTDSRYVAGLICSNSTEGDTIIHFDPQDFCVLVSNQIYAQLRNPLEKTDNYFKTIGYLSYTENN